MAQQLKLPNGALNPLLVTAVKLAAKFDPPRSERTIRTWQKSRTIPYYKVGRAVLFDPQEVFAHLAKHNRVNPAGGGR